MQSVENIAIDVQMMYSVVDKAMDKIVPNNCSNLAASGSNQIFIGSNILNCCLYLKKKIQNNSFDGEDLACYLEMKSYYNSFFYSCF
jgi:hypothetical protein